MPENRRLFIRSTNWIGDAVMSIPALREIRRIHPGWRITLFAKDWVAGIYRGQGMVDEILAFPSGSSSLRWTRELRRRSFDRCILLQNAFEAALLAVLSRIPERFGYAVDGRGLLLTGRARPRIRQLGRHQVYYYLDLLHQTGLTEIDYLGDSTFRPDITMTPTHEGRQGLDRLRQDLEIPPDARLIGLNPGAYFGPAKRWPTRRYAALADRLIDELGATVLIFGSKSEIPLAEEIQAYMQRRALSLAGKTDLLTLIALIDETELFITNDSGPMHLAAALGVPQIALFGSTDEIATGPFSEEARVIHKHVECSPCLRRECPIDLRCFTRIEVDEVLGLAVEILT